MTNLTDKSHGYLQIAGTRRLTATEFQGLADMPVAAQWFANLGNPRTRRA